MPSPAVLAALSVLHATLCSNITFHVEEKYSTELPVHVLMQASVRFRHVMHNSQLMLVPQALAQHLGVVHSTDLSDFVVEINAHAFPEGHTSAYMSQVMLHEVLHGLGFFSMIAHYPVVTNQTLYSIYDHYLMDDVTNVPLVDSLGQEGDPKDVYSSNLYNIFGESVYNQPWHDSLVSLSHLQDPRSSIYPYPEEYSGPLKLTDDAIKVLHKLGWCSHLELEDTGDTTARYYRLDRCYSHDGLYEEPCPPAWGVWYILVGISSLFVCLLVMFVVCDPFYKQPM